VSEAAAEDGSTMADLNADGKPHEMLGTTINITEPGYVYIWLSNESTTPVPVYFDDFAVTHTKSPVVQSNDHFAFGMDISSFSYQRESGLRNDFLYNGGSEQQVNVDANIYDMPYRGMDVSIGRMMQVDPMSDLYSSISPYNYAFNNPVFFSDPMGDEPPRNSREYIDASRNMDMERNYYHSHGVIRDDDLYERAFVRAGTMGLDYSLSTPATSWQDHIATIFPSDVLSDVHITSFTVVPPRRFESYKETGMIFNPRFISMSP